MIHIIMHTAYLVSGVLTLDLVKRTWPTTAIDSATMTIISSPLPTATPARSDVIS